MSRQLDYYTNKFDIEKIIHEIKNLQHALDTGSLSNVGGQAYTSELMRIQFYLIVLKTQRYKDSWRKRGFHGAIHNLFRKYDRLENIVKDIENYGLEEVMMSQEEDSIIDTLGDLANYAVLIMGLLISKYPESGEKYLNQVFNMANGFSDAEIDKGDIDTSDDYDL